MSASMLRSCSVAQLLVYLLFGHGTDGVIV
jgi:hypothetical protein